MRNPFMGKYESIITSLELKKEYNFSKTNALINKDKGVLHLYLR